MTDIYLHFLCAHYRLSANAPVSIYLVESRSKIDPVASQECYSFLIPQILWHDIDCRSNTCLNTGWGGFSVAADLDEAARISMEAGMDTELCQPTDMRGLAFNRTAGLVRSGRMDVKHLDRAVANLLRCAWLYFGSVRLVFGSISR